ncbi:MAG: hypothetical protein QW238_02700 [Candidatus Bathyarchaeia archaeon]
MRVWTADMEAPPLKVDRVLYRVDGILAWILYLLFMLMMISGYMITRGFLSYRIGAFIHTRLDAPTMALLSVHAAVNMRWMLTRKGINRLLRDLIPPLFGLIPLTIILYLDAA